MSRPRSAFIGLVALLLLLAVVQAIPRGAPERGSLEPQARQDQSAPLAAPATTAGLGTLTAADRTEIDRVVAEGATTSASPAIAGASLRRAVSSSAGGGLVRSAVRCAEFEGQRYCLGSGWTDRTEKQVRRDTLAAARRQAARPPARGTGDLNAVSELGRLSRKSPVVQARADRAELTMAARSVAKVWLLRHQVQGVPLPDGFLERHPEIATVATAGVVSRTATTTAAKKAAKQKATRQAKKKRAIRACMVGQRAKGLEVAKAAQRCRRSYQKANQPAPEPTPVPVPAPTPTPTPVAVPTPSTSTAASTAPVPPAAPAVPPVVTEKTYDQYPEQAAILDKTQVAEQTRNYWCGPTAMQMIAWGASGVDQGQDYWAAKLGTTTRGTGIGKMVKVINSDTTWDDAAGPYVPLDIRGFTYDQWMLLIMKHVVDIKAPVMLHPVLLKKYYPYLDDDGSGHFQVGRGYQKKGAKPDLLGYFEPWNQQRFDPSEPSISRVQWRNAYKSYRANEDHFQHNLGV